MPKWNKRALRRATMTSKMGNMDYYKGRGARNEGTHTNKGGYVVRAERLMRIVAPANMDAFPLKPYVHAQARRPARGARVPALTAAPPAPAAAEAQLR
jgi:hypothetical protein